MEVRQIYFAHLESVLDVNVGVTCISRVGDTAIGKTRPQEVLDISVCMPPVCGEDHP